ncbi:MAG: sulfite exporter TauE/SafE family protein [Halomonadaceae bacterium]|nr:MAG: sulfite exporter TauE/SafE family protein [Halomonadaceae bacterium]
MVSEWLVAFLLGVVSSTHCLGMCGGITGALTFSLAPEVRASRSKLLFYSFHYHAGRITSYALAGAIAAGGVALLSDIAGAHSQPVMQFIGAAFMVAIGLYIAGWFPRFDRIERLGAPLWRYLEPIGQRVLPVRTLPQAYAFGLVWGWLPCGLVYSALIYSLSTASMAQGMAVMVFFGLGTVPMLLLVALMAERVLRAIRHPHFRRLAGISIIMLASVPIIINGL